MELERGMSQGHIDRDRLESYLSDELPEAESREIQRHLFICTDCEERMLVLLHGEGAEGGDRAEEGGQEYRGVLKRVLAGHQAELGRKGSRLSRERAEAGALLAELFSQPAEHRLALLRSRPSFHSWGLYEALIDRARQEIFTDARGAAAGLRLAIEVAEHLDRGRYGPGSVEAAQARAWAYLGNTLRVLFDFQGAEEAFAVAESHFDKSWLDPLDEALLLELKALLRRGERRFDEALTLLSQSIALYREVNEPHCAGRALIAKALALQYAGEIDAACAALREALFLIDPAEEPRLLLVAHGNLANCLLDAGRFAEAEALIADLRPLWEEVGAKTDLLRLRWLEGQVATGLGRLAEAEAALVEVRAAFLADENAYDVALASLDLAAVYARQGRAAETRGLAAEMLPIFRSREIHREALAALACFQRAAEMEQVTLSMIDEVSSYLERARANPGLRFRAEGENETPPVGEVEPRAS
jgi:tetratricopeptide (TPR) repeat protein